MTHVHVQAPMKKKNTCGMIRWWCRVPGTSFPLFLVSTYVHTCTSYRALVYLVPIPV